MPGVAIPNQITPAERLLTAAEFHRLAEVPPEFEWFANLTNPSTKRAYEKAVGDFMRFAGIVSSPASVSLPGAASRSRAWWSPSAGVRPSPLSARGRFTPLTGL